MGLVVRGTHTGREYDLSEPVDTEIEAGAIKRREERNGHYSDIRVVDLDQYEEGEFRKLPKHELEAAARNGHPVAARLLGLKVAEDEPTDADLRAEVDELRAVIERLQSERENEPQPAEGDDGPQGDEDESPFVASPSTSGKATTRRVRGKASD